MKTAETKNSDPILHAEMSILSMLRRELAIRQVRRSHYSLRAFALSLKLTPSELSELFSGKRKMTRNIARKIFIGLGVDPTTEQTLISALPEKQIRQKRIMQSMMLDKAKPQKKTQNKIHPFIQLSTDEFRVLADWYHLAILSLAEIKGFQSNPEWISKRLSISKHEVKSAIDTLLRLGLLKQIASGQLKITGKQFTTTNDIPDASIRKNHAQSLELALDALESIPVELREFSASVIAADPNLLPEAKQRLRELRREIAKILEGGTKKEVYRLSIQLFPLSRN